MAKGLDIRRRIKSVKSTRSITKAMQMVAASKMRKAQEQALKTRGYAEKSLEVLAAVAEKLKDYNHYLLNKTEGNRCLVLLITSNKGLCGSLNANVLRKALELFESKERPGQFDFVTLGKKGRDTLFRMGKKVVADFSDIGESLSFNSFTPIIKFLFNEYKAEKYDRVYIVYSHFVSVLVQRPVIKRLLPLGGDMMDYLKEILNKKQEGQERRTGGYEYVIEPTPEQVLEALLPRLTEMQIFQAFLESYASEQSARMVAMKNATDAAGDLIEDLTLHFNKMRQSGITQEISEIVGGAEALNK